MEECDLPKAKTKFKGSIFSGDLLSSVATHILNAINLGEMKK